MSAHHILYVLSDQQYKYRCICVFQLFYKTEKSWKLSHLAAAPKGFALLLQTLLTLRNFNVWLFPSHTEIFWTETLSPNPIHVSSHLFTMLIVRVFLVQKVGSDTYCAFAKLYFFTFAELYFDSVYAAISKCSSMTAYYLHSNVTTFPPWKYLNACRVQKSAFEYEWVSFVETHGELLQRHFFWCFPREREWMRHLSQ